MKKFFLLAISTVFSITNAYNPGATASLNAIALEHHKGIIANFILAKIETVKVPTIDFGYSSDGSCPGICGHILDANFTLSRVTKDQVTLQLLEEENAILITIENLMAKFQSLDVKVEKGIL
jgi:hypothetical protein